MDEKKRELYKSLQPGDVVRVTRYMVDRLSALGPMHDESVEGREAVVISLNQKCEPYLGPRSVSLRLLENNQNSPHWISFDRYPADDWSAELVRRGRGFVTAGVDYQLSPNEAQDLRFEELKRRLHSIDWSYQGYSNAPTFLAALYLRNHAPFMASLASLRRRDGTINPNKVERAFRDARLSVDPWAYCFPIDIPDEFKHHSLGRYQPQVKWSEVAADFTAEKGP